MSALTSAIDPTLVKFLNVFNDGKFGGPAEGVAPRVLDDWHPRTKVVQGEGCAVRTKDRMHKTILRKKNILTVPREIAEHMRLAEGDEFIVTEEQGRIVLTPALSIPADQAWFWTAQWQERVAESEADRLAGNSTAYVSDEQFLASLEDV